MGRRAAVIDNIKCQLTLMVNGRIQSRRICLCCQVKTSHFEKILGFFSTIKSFAMLEFMNPLT